MAEAEISIKLEHISADEISDAVTRSRAGDEDAFHHLFRRYSKPLLDFINNMVGDRGLAEELTQDAFVRAYRNLSNLREASKFSTWLFGIAKNIVREALRERASEGRRVCLDEQECLDIEDEGLRPDERALDAELNGAVKRAVLHLNEDQRTVFILKFINQQTYEEICEITGWSMGKVKTDLHRARIEVKRRLLRYLG